MQDFLKDLDPRQQEVVTCTEGPLLVFAGAGSGKTRSIIYRTAYLVNEIGIPPWNILIVTFTNKAANELKERLQGFFKVDLRTFWVGTFHSICARLLRYEANEANLGFDSNFTIYDVEDSLSLLRKVYKEMNISKESYPLKRVQHIISSTKNSLITPDDFFEMHEPNQATKLIHRVYTSYQKKLRENNSLDFDDLLMVTAQMLSQNEAVKSKYNHKFHYVMIDEYQDTNYAQFYIVKQLSGGSSNICVVGDDDQAIYSWRGATIKNILNFATDFNQAKTIRLEQNYRSSQKILDRANKLIDYNKTRHPKTLWSQLKEGEEPLLHFYETDREEAEGVIRRFEELQYDNAGNKETSVILYRTNAQSRVFEAVCIDHKINYKIHGSVNFFQRKEIKDIIAYLRILLNPNDLESLFRIINFPPRGIGQTTINKVIEYAAKNGISMIDTMKDGDFLNSLNKGTAAKIDLFASLIEKWSLKAQKEEVTDVLQEICEDIQVVSYYQNCSDHKDVMRLENVYELMAAVKEYADNYVFETGETPLLEGFLQNISLWTDLEEGVKEDDEEAVLHLMTLHNAKGLEFDNVFVVGIEEKLLPHQLCIDSSLQVEEERRLLYVGMTRAKQRLFLSFTRFRRTFHGYEDCYASRFLREIFPEYQISEKGIIGKNFMPQKKDKPSEIMSGRNNRITFNHQKGKSGFYVGQRVVHHKYGEGTVRNIDGEGDRAKLRILFDDGRDLKIIACFVETLTDKD